MFDYFHYIKTKYKDKKILIIIIVRFNFTRFIIFEFLMSLIFF
jgi:hypothetical protein